MSRARPSKGALHGLGFPSVSDVRVGKTIAFDLASEDRAAAEAQVREMAERLLANPVIQSWRVEFGA
jgi:phosphoribosylformylglycinamidine synthase